MPDPLQPLVELDGVADAADRARAALAAIHRHPANRRGWARNAAEAAIRAARASAAIEGAGFDLPADGQVAEPVLAGTIRLGQALDGHGLANMVAVWRRAPLQALARMHLLAAADLVRDSARLGRPREDPGVSQRLTMLGNIALTSTAPAPVIAAVVHGELLALRPFGSMDGVIARAASRLVAVASGLDPHSLGVPEVSWMRYRDEYRNAAAGFESGQPDGLRTWIVGCCSTFENGAREAGSIADAVASS